MKTGILYFSGTHVTALVSGAVQKRLEERGVNSELRDITPLRKRRELDTNAYDALILGFPVYSDFAPSVINEWLMTLEGRGRPCILFCTYGGRTSGYFHYHTWQILKERGFSVLMSAEFLGRHTFNLAGWNVLPGRPNEEDLKVAADLADRAAELFESENPELLSLQKPLGYKEKLAAVALKTPPVSPSPNQPFRKEKECSRCGLCERDCPAGAITAEGGQADPQKCLMCQRCLYHCPDKVLIMHEAMYMSYEGFLKDWNLTEADMEKKRSKLILHAGDTVQ